MELARSNGILLADNVEVAAGKSWFSQQLELPFDMSGVSYEVWLKGGGTGSFLPRGGNRIRHHRGSSVAATPTTYVGSEHLPELPGIYAADLPDVTTAPFEKLINIGNINCNFVELCFKCLTGRFWLTVIAACRPA